MTARIVGNQAKRACLVPLRCALGLSDATVHEKTLSRPALNMHGRGKGATIVFFSGLDDTLAVIALESSPARSTKLTAAGAPATAYAGRARGNRRLQLDQAARVAHVKQLDCRDDPRWS